MKSQDVYRNFFYGVVSVLVNKIDEKHEKKPRLNKDYYSFIPYESDHLINVLIELEKKVLKRKNKTIAKFLDVGCGVGNIMALAKSIGYEVDGVEYDKRLEKYSLLEKYSINYIDAFDYEFYKSKDVIYFYRPIYDVMLQLRLELKIVTEMKPGAFLIPLLCEFHFTESCVPDKDREEANAIKKKIFSVIRPVPMRTKFHNIIYKKCNQCVYNSVKTDK